MINFGRMNNKVQFKKLSYIKNEFNEVTKSYEDVVSRMVNVIPLSNDLKEEQNPHNEKRIKIRMRYTDKIDSSMFVETRGELYRIDSLEDYDYGMREYILECSLVVPDTSE